MLSQIFNCWCVLLAQLCPTLCNPMDCSLPGSSVHDSPGKNTPVGCHSLLQGIFPIQRLNLHLLCLLYWQAGSLPLVPPGKPKYCDIMIYNKKYLFAFHICLWRRVPKTFEISWILRAIKHYFCYVHVMTFEKFLGDMGTGFPKNQLHD